MTNPQPKTHLIPVRVTEAQHAYLEQLAEELDVPVSTAFRHVLEDAIRGRALVDQVESMLQQDGLVSEETAGGLGGGRCGGSAPNREEVRRQKKGSPASG
jgi:hypothetical protein